MVRIFISHSSKEDDLATQLHDWLTADGHEVFLDHDWHGGIRGGEPWKERLYEQLRAADAMLCLVTGDYVASQWCFGEIITAQTLGSKIVPLAVEPGVQHPPADPSAVITIHPRQSPLQIPAQARPQAWDQIREILRELDVTGGAGWPDDCSPFPGLRAFDVYMHRAFFGRRAEVDSLVRLLRSLTERGDGKLVVVVGPSGCGKSSLVCAGLVPAMTGEPGWATLTPFIPGTDPLTFVTHRLLATRQHENMVLIGVAHVFR